MANKHKQVAALPQLPVAIEAVAAPEPVEVEAPAPEHTAEPEIIEPQPPQDNDHVAPGAELFAQSAGPIALAAWAVIAEKQAENIGVTVCEITHPEAVHGAIHQGAASGIRLVKGDAVAALLSDGSTI